MQTPVYDVLIIGAGPIGMACGIEATKKGLSYLILEKGYLVNSIYHYPKNMTFFSTSLRIEIGDVPFVSHGPKPTRSEALEYYRRVADTWNLDIHTYESVEDLTAEDGLYRVSSTRGSYLAHSVIIATGFYDHANLLSVPGEELPKVRHYYEEAHPFIGKKIVVVGAANSAIDVAMETWRAGAEVTLVVRKPEISHRVKYWIKPDIENRIKEGSISAYFNSQLTAIRETEVDIETPEGPLTLKNDFVLAMTGYHPDFSWLRNMGLEIHEDETMMPYANEKTFETNLPRVYIAGTVCGGMKTSTWFIENSIEHAQVVMEDI
ncbi:MAG: YpdA family putative bacillithiol disulfide reductase, partial [Bacteroidota bacterium]